jgi:tetratricopeptide (TPR) repeat protein
VEVPEDITPAEEAEALPEEEAVPEGEELAPAEEAALAEALEPVPAEEEAVEPAVAEQAVPEIEAPRVDLEVPSVAKPEPEPAPAEAAEPEIVEEALEPEAITTEEEAVPAAIVEEVPVEDLGQFIARQRSYAEERPEDHEAWLELGRVLWQADKRDEAVETYDHLIRRSELLDEIIPDLEDYAEQWADPSVRQALGDAYMRADRLQDALNVYRQALASL